MFLLSSIKKDPGPNHSPGPCGPHLGHFNKGLKVIYSNICGGASKVHLADKVAIADRNVVPGARLQLFTLLFLSQAVFLSTTSALAPSVVSLSLHPLEKTFSTVFYLSSHPRRLLSLRRQAPLLSLLSVLTPAYTSPSLFPPRRLPLNSRLPLSS